MSLLEATLHLEQLLYAIECKQNLAETLEARHAVYQRATQHTANLKGSCLVHMGHPCTLTKLRAKTAAQLVESELRAVWEEVQHVRLELHRLEMKAEEVRQQVKERRRMEEEAEQMEADKGGVGA